MRGLIWGVYDIQYYGDRLYQHRLADNDCDVPHSYVASAAMTMTGRNVAVATCRSQGNVAYYLHDGGIHATPTAEAQAADMREAREAAANAAAGANLWRLPPDSSGTVWALISVSPDGDAMLRLLSKGRSDWRQGDMRLSIDTIKQGAGSPWYDELLRRVRLMADV